MALNDARCHFVTSSYGSFFIFVLFEDSDGKKSEDFNRLSSGTFYYNANIVMLSIINSFIHSRKKGRKEEEGERKDEKTERERK